MFSLCALFVCQFVYTVVCGQGYLRGTGRELPSAVPQAETTVAASAKSPAGGKLPVKGSLPAVARRTVLACRPCSCLSSFLSPKLLQPLPLQRKTSPGDLKGSCQNKYSSFWSSHTLFQVTRKTHDSDANEKAGLVVQHPRIKHRVRSPEFVLSWADFSLRK